MANSTRTPSFHAFKIRPHAVKTQTIGSKVSRLDHSGHLFIELIFATGALFVELKRKLGAGSA